MDPCPQDRDEMNHDLGRGDAPNPDSAGEEPATLLQLIRSKHQATHWP